MSAQMQHIVDAIESQGADPTIFDAMEIPDHYRGLTIHADEVGIFADLPRSQRDPRKSLHVEEVPTPDVGPGEALIAVMASSMNFNTVWAASFLPVPTFDFLSRYGKYSELTKKHDRDYHVLGSDLAGVVLKVGPGVTAWKPGDRVVAHCLSVELESPQGHDDSLLDPDQRTWGFETNFGGLAELALVKGNQLLRKPEHLTWEEAASVGLVNSTAYRQLVSANGAAMKQGDNVLIWGASGGIGSFATQYALNGGAQPICVVSSEDKAQLCRRMGAQLVINRAEHGYRFWTPDGEIDEAAIRRFGAHIRDLTGGEDPDIVFEHPGRETFAASVYVARRGGKIVTCASSSGYQHQYDNRHLWMKLKRIIGSHFANYRESYEANRLVSMGRIHPTLSKTFPLAMAPDAAFEVHENIHQGKVGVLCLAPDEGRGVKDEALRARHLPEIERFRVSLNPA